LSKNKGKWINQLEYCWIIGILIYVIKYTRLNITYLISKLSRFTSTLSIDNWKAIKKNNQIYDTSWTISYIILVT
jgi:hypothetical protein